MNHPHTTRAVRRKALAVVKRLVGPDRASFADAGVLFGVPPSTVWRWVTQGRLPNARSTRKIMEAVK